MRFGLVGWRGLLFFAALDSAAMGFWGLFRPADLFTLLQYLPSNDGLLLCRALGFLFLMHAPCLILAGCRPTVFGGLALAPLFGRLLSSGVWLWLLSSGRMPNATGALIALLAHDAVWLPLLAGFLWRCRAAMPV